MSEIYDDVM